MDRHSRLLKKLDLKFQPSQVPEISAGYWWDPARVTGSGATFAMPEAQGKSAYDLVTPASNTTPVTGTLNSKPTLTFTNGSPDQLLRTAATKTRGWTGATYMALWLQASAAPGSVAGHWRTANNLLLQLNAGDSRVNGSDGGAAVGNRFAALTFGATPYFLEAVFDPSQGSTGRLRYFVDLAELTPTLTSSIGTTLADTAEYISIGGTAGDSTTLNYTATFTVGRTYLGNGIPSSANRARLYAAGALK